MQCFLDCALDTQFVILENADVVDEFVQFKLNQKIVYGEVGSREWDVVERRRPLDAEARELLATLGFTHGGPERNYICDNLAQSAPYLADLVSRLNIAAYGSVPVTMKVKVMSLQCGRLRVPWQVCPSRPLTAGSGPITKHCARRRSKRHPV
jgi:hypothetical protein